MAGQPEEVLPEHVTLPRPPAGPPSAKNPSAIWEWIRRGVIGWMHNLIRDLESTTNRLLHNVNSLTAKGDDLVAAPTILLSSRSHLVTGSGAITTINASPGFRGYAFLLSDGGGWTLATGGNIAAPAAPADGEMVTLFYDLVGQKWHPTGGGGGGSPHLGYVILGIAPLVGTKNDSNKTFTLPGGHEFFLDVNGNSGGVLFLNANPLSPTDVAPVAGDFEYQRTNTTTVLLSEAPSSGDFLAFLMLPVVAP